MRESKKQREALNTKDSLKVGSKIKAGDLVDIEITGDSKHLKKGAKKKVHRLVADKLVKLGVAELVAMFLVLFLAFAPVVKASAQVGTLANLTSSYSATSDTVTNTGTAYLTTSDIKSQYKSVTVVACGTEISGTTGGSVVLQGSLDGTNFVTLTSTTHVPNIAAKTPTDVTTVQCWSWEIQYSPYTKYRVLWTGTGTMIARLHSAKVLAH